MLERDYLEGRSIAFSISESEDLAARGLSHLHLADAFGEFCRHVLADGGSIIYAGDLRVGGFTELLYELIEQYRPLAKPEEVVFTNVLPWPVHMTIDDADLGARRKALGRGVRLLCLSQTGTVIRTDYSEPFEVREPDGEDWSIGLSSMRAATTSMADLRVLLGGRTAHHKGIMPGVAEEALKSLEHQQPLFLVGGFGGCVGDICARLGFWPSREITKGWKGMDHFGPRASLNNGLTEQENITLATTSYVDEAVTLLLRGVTRLFHPKHLT